MASNNMLWMRLKPYNPQFGYVKRRFFHSPSGIKLFDPGVWILIPAELRSVFAKKRQDDSVPTSPPLVDFAEDEDEKLAVEQEYRTMVVEASRRAGRPIEVAVTEYTRENLRPRILSTLDLAAPESKEPAPTQPTEVVDIEPPQEEAEDTSAPTVGAVETVSIPAENMRAGDETPQKERKARRRERSTPATE